MIYIAEFNDLDLAIKLADKYKMGIEIQRFVWPHILDNPDNDRNKILAKISNISKRSLHGAFFELVPASQDNKIRELVKMRFNQSYRVAQELDAKHLILHSGYIPKTYPLNEWLKHSTEFWQGFLADKENDIEIHMENVFENVRLINNLIEGIDSNILSVCLDIGHVNLHSSSSVEEWIKVLDKKIKYVHLHNNNGIDDDHFGLNTGKMNIIRILELLKEYSPLATWTIETTEKEESCRWLKENGII